MKKSKMAIVALLCLGAVFLSNQAFAKHHPNYNRMHNVRYEYHTVRPMPIMAPMMHNPRRIHNPFAYGMYYPYTNFRPMRPTIMYPYPGIHLHISI